MTLKLTLIDGKRITRKRNQPIVARNTKENNLIVTEFFDQCELDNKCIPSPFLKVNYGYIKQFRGATPIVSTFAK